MKELEKLQNLIAGHAYWSDKKSNLKIQGGAEFSNCERINVDKPNSFDVNFDSCLDVAHKITYKLNKENNPGVYYYFEDVWSRDIDDKFQPCQRCINGRKIKAERVNASMRLGAIRAAMTRLGRNLDYRDKGNLVTYHNIEKIDFNEDIPF